jgi:hypothetical protein
MLPSKEQQLPFSSHLKDELLLSFLLFQKPISERRVSISLSVPNSTTHVDNTRITLWPFVRETLHEHHAIRDLPIQTLLSLHSLLQETGYTTIKVGLWERLAVCKRASPCQLLSASTKLYENWYVHDATLDHLDGVFHKSLPSLIPTLTPKLLRSWP